MEDVLQEDGHSVVIADATEAPLSLSEFETVLIGGSTYMHKYQSAIGNYILNHLETLNKTSL